MADHTEVRTDHPLTDGEAKAIHDDLREPTSSLRHALPQVWNGFLSLHGAVMADGEVPTRSNRARGAHT